MKGRPSDEDPVNHNMVPLVACSARAAADVSHQQRHTVRLAFRTNVKPSFALRVA